MTYLMKRGCLYGDDREAELAVIHSELNGLKKQVEAGGRLYTADVLPGGYRMEDESKQPVLEGKLGYAAGEDPAQFGWPLCRTPRRDHVCVQMEGREWMLEQLNCQNYRLLDSEGTPVLEVLHRGLTGGWILEAQREFEPWVLCGIFLFCLYLDRENEFAVV